MKKTLKKLLKLLVLVFIILNALILISGRGYLYKGIQYTYLSGKTGPDIEDLELFAKREISTATPQAWEYHTDYNSKEIAEEYIVEMERLQSVSFTIIKDKKVYFEKYWEGYDITSISNSFSAAKSITSVLIGMAIEEGFIESVFQPIGDFLPEFKKGKKAEVTLKDMLTMSSGLSWDEGGKSPFSDNAEAYYGTDLRAQIERLEVVAEPGKEFIYLSGNTQILGFVIQEATGMTLSEYASKKLWQPLGAEHPAFWSLDVENGMEKAYCCYYATALDFARIGQLYLDKGKWNGEQLIDSTYVKMSTRANGLKEVDGTDCKRYGYQWWVAGHKGYEVFYARGILGQYIIGIPALNAVVTRAGHKRGPVGEDGHPADLYTILDAAFDLLEVSEKE